MTETIQKKNFFIKNHDQQTKKKKIFRDYDERFFFFLLIVRFDEVYGICIDFNVRSTKQHRK